MLTSVGRAAARRVLFVRSAKSSSTTTSIASSATPYYFARQTRLPLRFAPDTRTFSVLAASRFAAKDASATTTTKKRTTTKKAGTGQKKKTAAKKKAGRPRKTKKAAPKKKVLTAEEKQAKKNKREAKKVMQEKSALRSMALVKGGPPTLPSNKFALYLSQNLKGVTGVPGKEEFTQLAASYRSLSSSQTEALGQEARANAVANKAAYIAWVEAHPPEAIYLANWARKRLNRVYQQRKLYPLHDTRLPKRSRNPFNFFLQPRISQHSGHPAEAFRGAGAEWRAMSEGEKRPYLEQAAADQARSREQIDAIRQKAEVLKKEHLAAVGQVKRTRAKKAEV